MAAKAILVLCAQALVLQCAFNQRVCRGVGMPFPMGGQNRPYSGLMNDGMVAFDNFGYNYPSMDYAASTMMPGSETLEPYMGEMPFFDYGYNMPVGDPMMAMAPEMPMMAEPMPFIPQPAMMVDPLPMNDMPVMMDPVATLINEPMNMAPMYPIVTDPICPIPEPIYPIVTDICPFPEPMCSIVTDPMYPFPEPMCSIVTDPMYPTPMPMPMEEIVTPCRGSPTIAPSASLSVVVMDSSIQNLFENLWNVVQ